MELKRLLVPAAHAVLPHSLREKLYGENWLKERVDVALRGHEEALNLRTHPLPQLELQFVVTNRLPAPLQLYGASVEIWLGKPVVHFYAHLGDSLRPGERRDSFRAYTFLNSYQLELLNPGRKNSLPPDVTANLTLSCRSPLGMFEKSAGSTWTALKILP